MKTLPLGSSDSRRTLRLNFFTRKGKEKERVKTKCFKNRRSDKNYLLPGKTKKRIGDLTLGRSGDLVQQIINEFVVNLSERNPNGELDISLTLIGRNNIK